MKRILIFLAFCSLLTFANSCMSSRQYRYDRDGQGNRDRGIVIGRNNRNNHVIGRNKRVIGNGDGDRDDRLTRRERRERERQRQGDDNPVIVIDPNR